MSHQFTFQEYNFTVGGTQIIQCKCDSGLNELMRTIINANESKEQLESLARYIGGMKTNITLGVYNTSMAATMIFNMTDDRYSLRHVCIRNLTRPIHMELLWNIKSVELVDTFMSDITPLTNVETVKIQFHGRARKYSLSLTAPEYDQTKILCRMRFTGKHLTIINCDIENGDCLSTVSDSIVLYDVDIHTMTETLTCNVARLDSVTMPHTDLLTGVKIAMLVFELKFTYRGPAYTKRFQCKYLCWSSSNIPEPGVVDNCEELSLVQIIEDLNIERSKAKRLFLEASNAIGYERMKNLTVFATELSTYRDNGPDVPEVILLHVNEQTLPTFGRRLRKLTLVSATNVDLSPLIDVESLRHLGLYGFEHLVGLEELLQLQSFSGSSPGDKHAGVMETLQILMDYGELKSINFERFDSTTDTSPEALLEKEFKYSKIINDAECYVGYDDVFEDILE
jgi:hypothetical protein